MHDSEKKFKYRVRMLDCNNDRIGALFVYKISDEDYEQAVQNVNRIVECVNACAGLTSDQIAGLPKIIDEGALAIIERNELLEVTKKLVHAIKFRTLIGVDIIHEIVEVDNVLSKINGKGGSYD